MKFFGIGIPELIIILVVFGIPITLLVVMLRRSSKADKEYRAQRDAASLAPPPLPQQQPTGDLQQPHQEAPVIYAQALPQAANYDPPSPPGFSPPQENVATDTYLYEAFAEGDKVGTAKQRIMSGIMNGDRIFNVFAFLFGPFYFAYRKCFTEVFIIFAIMGVVTLLPFDLRIGSATIGLIYGFIFYPLYRMHARKAVEQAKGKGCNAAAVQQLRDEGGTSIVAIFATLGAYVIYVVILVFFYLVIYG